MAKLKFPAVSGPYRGMIDRFRGMFQEIASYAEKSPAAKSVVAVQIDPLLTNIGYVQTLPPNQARVTNGQQITATGGRFNVTVVNGVIGGTWTAA